MCSVMIWVFDVRFFFFFKQKTAYDVRISDWSSDVCSSDLIWGEGEVCLMIQIRNSPALDAFWMPFTANRQFKRAPRLLASASGMYYRSADGREIMDGTAGLWCVKAGPGKAELADAAAGPLRT